MIRLLQESRDIYAHQVVYEFVNSFNMKCEAAWYTRIRSTKRHAEPQAIYGNASDILSWITTTRISNEAIPRRSGTLLSFLRYAIYARRTQDSHVFFRFLRASHKSQPKDYSIINELVRFVFVSLCVISLLDFHRKAENIELIQPSLSFRFKYKPYFLG